MNIEKIERKKEQPPAERTKKVLAIVRTNTERMNRLVDDLFRLTAEKSSEMCEEVPPKEVFAEIVEELTPQIEKKCLTVCEYRGGKRTRRGDGICGVYPCGSMNSYQ